MVDRDTIGVPKWENVASGYDVSSASVFEVDASSDGWTEFWHNYGEVILITENINLPNDEVIAAEHERDLLSDAYLESLRTGEDVTGFITATQHPNRKIRQIALTHIDEVFNLDPQLAMAGLRKLSLDKEPKVRLEALRTMMSILYGEDDGGFSKILVMPEYQRILVLDIFHSAIRSVNNAAVIE